MIKTKTICNRRLRRKNLLSRVRRVLVLIQVATKKVLNYIDLKPVSKTFKNENERRAIACLDTSERKDCMDRWCENMIKNNRSWKQFSRKVLLKIQGGIRE